MTAQLSEIAGQQEIVQWVLESIPQGIAVLDTEGRLVWMNRFTREQYGWTDEVIGRNLFEFRPVYREVGLYDAFRQVIERDQPVEALGVRHPDRRGRMLVRNLRGYPLHDEGRVSGVMVVIEDTTERQRAEEEIRRRSEELVILQEITSSIQSSLELELVLQRIVDCIVHGLDYNSAIIFLVREQEGIARVDAACSKIQLLPKINAVLGFPLARLEIPARKDFSETVKDTLEGRMTVKHDLYELAAPRLSRVTCSALQRIGGAKTFLALPLAARGKVVGGVFASTSKEELTKRDQEMLTTLANQAAIAIENAQLFQQVERAKGEWEATFDAIQDAVVVVSAEHEIIRANRAVARLIGLKIQEVPGRKCYRLLHGLDHPPAGCPVEECLRTGEPAFAEMEDPSGQTWHKWAYPLFDDEGKVQSAVEYSRDVTDWKRTQAQLFQAEKLSALGEIIAEVAHEINNPLTVILGYAQLLQRGEVGERTAQDLQVIEEAGRRCQRIINDLLTFGREREPQREYTDVNQVIQKTVALRAYHLRVSNIEVALELQPDLPRTMADPYQLQQVFLNLINNAEQAMVEAHGRGRLLIRSQRLLPPPSSPPEGGKEGPPSPPEGGKEGPPSPQRGGKRGLPPPSGGERRASLPPSGGERGGESGTIRLEFSDDGPGIPPELMVRLFDPFFTTKPEGQGTGLGLSVCYGIVKGHGGRIWAESQPGEGATFIVEFPVVAEGEAPAAIGRPPPATGVPLSARVLIVDDEPPVVRFLQRALRGRGLAVDVAYDGQEARDKINGGDYDLILCDIKMPGLDGRKLYACLPELAERFVFITGDTAAEDTRAFLQEAGRPWLSKPFTLEQVEATIRGVMRDE